MKVIGAGFGRTGTTSLKAALETLGFGPCYHMTEVFAHPWHADVWVAAARGETADLDAVLEGYESTVDWPACAFYEEIMQRHPEAKVLLSVRDPERWYESTRGTIYPLTLLLDSSPTVRLIFGLATLLAYGGFAGIKSSLPHDVIWDGTFDGRFEDRTYAIEVFEQHIEEVKRRVPSAANPATITMTITALECTRLLTTMPCLSRGASTPSENPPRQSPCRASCCQPGSLKVSLTGLLW